MKSSKIILLLFLGAIISSYQKVKPSKLVKEVHKSYVQIKPGMFIQKHELTNKQYRDFLESLKSSGQFDRYSENLLDTIKWSHPLYNNEPFVMFYHSYPSYDNYAVVTCRYESALDYCKWLTDTYNADNKRKYEKVLFRLPTEEEWIYAATAGNITRSYSFKGENVKGKSGKYLANFKFSESTTILNSKDTIQRHSIVGPVLSYEPNEFGLYNMSGNVAEMIQEKGIAKGGSYLDFSEGIKVRSRKQYSDASSEIGFRPIMEIIQE